MTGPLERAARALYRSAPHDYDPNQMGEDATWPDLVDQARAVLEAIREPSEGVKGAGWTSDLPYTPSIRVDVVWRAMIDAALSEKPE